MVARSREWDASMGLHCWALGKGTLRLSRCLIAQLVVKMHCASYRSTSNSVADLNTRWLL